MAPALPAGPGAGRRARGPPRDRRRQFVARCATGDWDGIVMSRSAFERIPLSAREQQAYLDRELDQMRAVDRGRQDGPTA